MNFASEMLHTSFKALNNISPKHALTREMKGEKRNKNAKTRFLFESICCEGKTKELNTQDASNSSIEAF